MFGLGSCRFMNRDYGGAVSHFSGFERKYRGTVTEPRGLLSLGCTSRKLKDEESRERVIRCFETLYRRYSNTYYGQKGLYYLGRVYCSRGLIDEGVEYFEELIGRYPNSIFCDLAKERIRKIKGGR